MKKHHQLIAIITFLLLSTFVQSSTFASENIWQDVKTCDEFHLSADNVPLWKLWPIQQLVAKDKVWTIRFNAAVDLSLVGKENVYIENEKRERLDLKVDIGQNRIKVSPKTPYADGDYRLCIQDLQSEQGKRMLRPYAMRFKVMESCPSSISSWLYPSPAFPSFTVSNKTDPEGRVIQLGMLVKDSKTGRIAGRVIEIKELNNSYELTMDDKCIHSSSAVNDSKSRRMYSFPHAKHPAFIVTGASGEDQIYESDDLISFGNNTSYAILENDELWPWGNNIEG